MARRIFQHNFHGRIRLRIHIGKLCHRCGAIPENMSSRYGDNEGDDIGLDTSTECRWHPSENCYAVEEKVEGPTKADMM